MMDKWQALYRRALDCANGLTNYVEDRPELQRIERELAAVEADARALAAQPAAERFPVDCHCRKCTRIDVARWSCSDTCQPASGEAPDCWRIALSDGTKFYHGHNAIGDYRQIDPAAISTPLYDHPPAQSTQPVAEFILRMLVAAGHIPQAKVDEAYAIAEKMPAAPVAPEPASPNALLEWACYRWRDEVQHRPLVNVKRRPLDDAWRQVVRYAGGDPVELLGPPHDELVQAHPELFREKPTEPVTKGD